MARFPYHKSNIKALGRLLAQAAVDETVRTELEKDPKRVLEQLGLPKVTTDLLTFQVVSESKDRKTVALPFKLNKDKLTRKDPNYLAELSDLFPKACLN